MYCMAFIADIHHSEPPRIPTFGSCAPLADPRCTVGATTADATSTLASTIPATGWLVRSAACGSTGAAALLAAGSSGSSAFSFLVASSTCDAIDRTA